MRLPILNSDNPTWKKGCRYATIAILAVCAVVLLWSSIPRARAADKGGDKGGIIGLPEIPKSGMWTGPSLYGAIGYDWTRTEFDAWSGDSKINTDEILATFGAGYDVKASSVVLGVMTDVTASNFNDVRWQWFVGVRAGVLVTPSTLVYGLAGYTEDIDGKLAFKSVETTKVDRIAGLTYGGGIEHIFGAGWSGRLEYRFVQFGDETAPDGVNDGLKDGTDIDTGAHQIRLGIVKRF